MQERLQETFRFFINHFFGFAFLFMGVAFIGSLPMLFVGDIFQMQGEQIQPSPLFPLVGIVALLFYMLSVGIYSYRFRALLEKKETSLGAEISKTLSKFFPIIGVGLLSGIMVFIGFVLFILPGIYIAIRLSFAYYYVLFNDCGPTEAIRKSFDNTKEVQWQLLGGMIILGLIFIAVQIPFGLLQNPESYNPYIELIVSVITAPVTALFSIFTLRYFDIVNGTYKRSLG